MKTLIGKPLAFVDVETTGLNPSKHVVLEIAILRTDRDEWYTKIKPSDEDLANASPKALKINGYTAEAWKDAPPLDEVVDDICTRLTGVIVVAHNSSFDKSFVMAMVSEHSRGDRIGYHWLDTVTLAYEHLVPEGLERLSLASVCEHAGISNEGAHSALIDARRCQAVYNHCKSLYRAAPSRVFGSDVPGESIRV